MFEELLGSLFSIESIARNLEVLPDAKTKVMDDLYPESMRSTHPFAQIGVREFKQIAHAVPVVRRGTQSYELGGGRGSIDFIEPQPIDTEMFVTAKELNDLKTLDPGGQDAWVQSKLNYGRNVLRATAEALACQSITGSISYPMKISGGFDTYTVDFGTVGIVTPAKQWNATGATLADVYKTLEKMAEGIEDNGFGVQVEFRAGSAVYAFLVSLIAGAPNDSRINAKVSNEGIVLGEYVIRKLKGRYRNPQTKNYVNAIGDNEILAVDKGTGFALKYMAIDNLNAGLAALPLFVNVVADAKGKGYTLNFLSTPFPMPIVDAMKKATVLS